MKVIFLMLVIAGTASAQNVSLNPERDSHFTAVDEGAHSARLGATFVGGLIGGAIGSSLFIYSLTQDPPQGSWMAAGIGSTLLLSSLGAFGAHAIWGGRSNYWGSLLGGLGGIACGAAIMGIGVLIELSYIEAQKILGNAVPLNLVLPSAVGLAVALILAPLFEVAGLDSSDAPSAFKSASLNIMPTNGGAMATIGMRF